MPKIATHWGKRHPMRASSRTKSQVAITRGSRRSGIREWRWTCRAFTESPPTPATRRTGGGRCHRRSIEVYDEEYVIWTGSIFASPSKARRAVPEHMRTPHEDCVWEHHGTSYRMCRSSQRVLVVDMASSGALVLPRGHAYLSGIFSGASVCLRGQWSTALLPRGNKWTTDYGAKRHTNRYPPGENGGMTIQCPMM